ncbi:MAG TPA: nuclear transport factor 2 family protein [Vicinamibacterales bacterium]|nr:nuclear transport factor 2 family protein [Vicinamibacterales bacterium]
MSTHGIARTVGVMALVVAGFLGWKHFFPSDEPRIVRRLEQLADEVTRSAADPSVGLARAARMAAYFTTDVVIDPGGGVPALHGREALMAVAGSLQPRTGSMRVALGDATVTLATEDSADVTLTVTFTRNAGTPEASFDAREFAVRMVRQQDAWLVASVTSIDTLR